MKVVAPHEMARIEKLAYEAGASEEEFMRNAGRGIADIVLDYLEREERQKHVILLCGKGNNTGDAYVAGTYLTQEGVEVIAFQIVPIETCSPLCQKHHQEFLEKGGRVKPIESVADVAFPSEALLVDGLFGTGFHGTVEEPFASVIEAANLSKLPTIAIDIPSGLNGETGEVGGTAIQADITIFLGLPKSGFFLQDGIDHVGIIHHVDFGLEETFIDHASPLFTLVTTDRAGSFLPPIRRSRHKYQAGHVVGLAGSASMPGAAILAATAAMRSGTGILHLLHPKGMENELALLPPEIIRIAYSPDRLDDLVSWMNRASATFIGPGIGRSDEAAHLLRHLLPQLTRPTIIDADALTLIAQHDLPIPKQAVLTPQTGEMQRLLHAEEKISPSLHVLNWCQEYANEKQIALVLKGPATFLFYPDEPILVNFTSDPGMATAGSGDVLTGVIASFLAQGLPPHQAATLGVHLHGLAGFLAAEELTSYCMVASSITDHLSDAFHCALHP